MAAAAACLALLIAIASPVVAAREYAQRLSIESLESERLNLITSLQSEKRVLEEEAGRLREVFRDDGQSVEGLSLRQKLLESANRYYGPIVNDLPEDSPLEERGTAMLGLGMIRSLTGPYLEAESNLNEARHSFQSLSDAHPTDSRFKIALATCCRRQSRLREQRGDIVTALQNADETLLIYQSLAKELPNDIAIKFGWAIAQRDLAQLQAIARKPTEAFDSLREAYRISEEVAPLWDNDPSSTLTAACMFLSEDAFLVGRIVSGTAPPEEN